MVAADIHRVCVTPCHNGGHPRFRWRAHHEALKISAETVGETGPALASRSAAENASQKRRDQKSPAVRPQGGQGRGAGHVDRAAFMPHRLRSACFHRQPSEVGLQVRRLDRDASRFPAPRDDGSRSTGPGVPVRTRLPVPSPRPVSAAAGQDPNAGPEPGPRGDSRTWMDRDRQREGVRSAPIGVTGEPPPSGLTCETRLGLQRGTVLRSWHLPTGWR